MIYKNRSVEEMDDYYGINELNSDYKIADCEKIQEAFRHKKVDLTLAECRALYEVYSDERFCAGWTGGVQEMSLESLYEILFPVLIDVLNDRVERIHQISIQLVEGNLVNLVEF